MARRCVLPCRQRTVLFYLPQRKSDLLGHDTLSEEDLQNIGARPAPSQHAGLRAAAVRAPLQSPLPSR